MRFTLALTSIVLVLCVFFATAAHAEPPSATVSVDELEILLVPQSKDELQETAQAWITALQTVVTEKSGIQIQILHAEGDAQEALRDQLSELRKERGALIKRTNIVLDALDDKGGDSSEFRQYVEAVSGVKVNITDATGLWRLVKDWATSPDGGIALLKGIGFFLLIIFVSRIIANIVGRLVRRSLAAVGKTPELLRNFLANTIRNVIFFIGVVVGLSQLGVNIGPLLAAIGGAGFVIGFALQGTLSNFAAGLMILLYRPYELGDVVSLAGVTGKVSAMTLVSTTILTPDNQVIVVPNSNIWGNVITNITGSDTRRVDMVFGIGYEDDMAKAQEILESILKDHPKVLAEPEPSVAVGELADSSVNYNVRPWSKTEDYWDVYFDITRQVKERFDAAGISIPFPQSDVHIHQVAAAT